MPKKTTAEDSPDDANLEKVIVRMPTEMHQAVKARAAAEERSMAQTVRRAVRMYLQAGVA